MFKMFGSHSTPVLYPNLCYNNVCYKGSALNPHVFTGISKTKTKRKQKKKQLDIALILSFVIGGYVYFSDSILLTWYCLCFFHICVCNVFCKINHSFPSNHNDETILLQCRCMIHLSMHDA